MIVIFCYLKQTGIAGITASADISLNEVLFHERFFSISLGN